MLQRIGQMREQYRQSNNNFTTISPPAHTSEPHTFESNGIESSSIASTSNSVDNEEYQTMGASLTPCSEPSVCQNPLTIGATNHVWNPTYIAGELSFQDCVTVDSYDSLSDISKVTTTANPVPYCSRQHIPSDQVW